MNFRSNLGEGTVTFKVFQEQAIFSFLTLKRIGPWRWPVMVEGENTPIVLVAAREELVNKLRGALADTVGLLHAETHHEAVTLLERLRSEISIAIVQLEHSNGWGLIGELTRHPKSVKIIATTSVYPPAMLEKVKDLGVDAVVPENIPAEEWRQTVETVLGQTNIVSE
jgi:DNA-binding NarL/FixJ family response regulator